MSKMWEVDPETRSKVRCAAGRCEAWDGVCVGKNAC
jgi:hypothetical protein